MEQTSTLARWRAKFSQLPGNLQVITLQMWMPLLFVTMFASVYLAAFHAPKFQDAPVTIVNSPAASQFTAQLSKASPGTFDFQFETTADEAVGKVRDGSAAAAVELPTARGDKAEITIASGHQYQAARQLKLTFQTAFDRAGQPYAITDLAPLPKNDAYGMSSMYLMLTWCVGGYISAMMVGMFGNGLRHRLRVAIIACMAVVSSLIAIIIAGPILGIFHGAEVWKLIGISIPWVFTVGLTVNGLAYFFGRFIAAPAMAIFVFLSIPSSGAAYPVWMMPGFFQDLHPFVVGGGITEQIKQIVYGVGQPMWKGWVMMGCYLAFAIIASVVGKRWREAKDLSRMLNGTSTMMAVAQAKMNADAVARREATLARFGLADPADKDPNTALAEAETESDTLYLDSEMDGRPASGRFVPRRSPTPSTSSRPSASSSAATAVLSAGAHEWTQADRTDSGEIPVADEDTPASMPSRPIVTAELERNVERMIRRPRTHPED
ncbi:ABC transporter permease [Williamsia sp. CHRR-6]|uniref:ABC transporter permease n=1 Tax=Williamsia sp. CHRR-6 TaxID=2835871 RepID=UPI001BD9B478|nr:ABC transporter permease [Williamsia sp. CHRR-6]MBT0566551.1 ABC transporter permease [Williamsia sp. CHRR-6]